MSKDVSEMSVIIHERKSRGCAPKQPKDSREEKWEVLHDIVHASSQRDLIHTSSFHVVLVNSIGPYRFDTWWPLAETSNIGCRWSPRRLVTICFSLYWYSRVSAEDFGIKFFFRGELISGIVSARDNIHVFVIRLRLRAATNIPSIFSLGLQEMWSSQSFYPRFGICCAFSDICRLMFNGRCWTAAYVELLIIHINEWPKFRGEKLLSFIVKLSIVSS